MVFSLEYLAKNIFWNMRDLRIFNMSLFSMEFQVKYLKCNNWSQIWFQSSEVLDISITIKVWFEKKVYLNVLFYFHVFVVKDAKDLENIFLKIIYK